MVRFHESLSDRSVYLPYFHHLSLDARVTHERLAGVCFVDYDRARVLVAESANADIVAVGRLAREHASADAEFALLISDAWHEHGLGTELLRRLISLARDEGIRRVFGDILNENDAMQKSVVSSASSCTTRLEKAWSRLPLRSDENSHTKRRTVN